MDSYKLNQLPDHKNATGKGRQGKPLSWDELNRAAQEEEEGKE